MHRVEIRICGLGGQGVVLAGQIIGRAAVYDGNNAVQTQSYGAEARGSAAKSEVIISDGKIGYPEVRKCDVLVAMNQEALDKNIIDLKEDGVLLIDSTNVKNVLKTKAKVFRISATENAEKTFGSAIYANMIMLGALRKATDVITEKSLEGAIEEITARSFADMNKRALKKGEETI